MHMAVYDVLPSPSNLHIWGKGESPTCPLCSRRGTLKHILSCCPKALGEGRYRGRHNQVLKAIAEAIAAGVEWAKCSCLSKKAITFIRAGEQPRPAAKTSSGILATARDWQLLVDLEKQLKFPNHIVTTTLRPDVVLSSESTKQVLLELTVPWDWETAWKRPLKGSLPSTRDWLASVDKQDGEQGVSQLKSEVGALRPDPCSEPSVC